MTSALEAGPTTTDPRLVTPTSVPGGTVAAIAGALLLAVTNVLAGLSPESGSTRDLIAWFGANAGLTELVAAFGLVAAALLVPGIWAVTYKLRTRGSVLATIGGWAMATGYLMSTVLSIESLTMLSLLKAGGNPELLAEASDNHTPITATALYVVFGLGALIGTLLLGIAMLRQRAVVPTWAGWAMVLSAPVRMVGLFTGFTLVGPPLASLLIALGFTGVLLTRRPAPIVDAR